MIAGEHVRRPLGRTAVAAAVGLSLAAGLAVHTGPAAAGEAGRVVAPKADVPLTGAPYWYLGWGNPPDPVEVMKASKVKAFTVAFILAKSKGACEPSWDSLRSIDNANDIKQANRIREAGGDVVPSMGGGTGEKLGLTCESPEALAGAYQKVISLYKLRAIDIDIEEAEFQDPAVTERQLKAVTILKKNNPGLRVFITIPVLQSGLDTKGDRLVGQAVSLGTDVDVWTVMPFYMGGAGKDMGELTVTSLEGVHRQLKKHYPKLSDARLYAKSGISSHAGVTGEKEEVTPANLARMRDYANEKGLGRFTFWSANRDRPCTSGSVPDSCSNTAQQPWDFSKVVGGYNAR